MLLSGCFCYEADSGTILAFLACSSRLPRVPALTCHLGYAPYPPFYLLYVWFPYGSTGWMSFASSAASHLHDLHVIHVNGRWMPLSFSLWLVLLLQLSVLQVMYACRSLLCSYG